MYDTPNRDHKKHRLRKNAKNEKIQVKDYISFKIWRTIFRSLIAGLNWKRRPVKKVYTSTKADNGLYNSHVEYSGSQGTIRSYTHSFLH